VQREVAESRAQLTKVEKVVETQRLVKTDQFVNLKNIFNDSIRRVTLEQHELKAAAMEEERRILADTLRSLERELTNADKKSSVHERAISELRAVRTVFLVSNLTKRCFVMPPVYPRLLRSGRFV
jgi:hypothetical protein